MKTALITGITGQDGSYMAELLLEKGYRVVAMVRGSSGETFSRIQNFADQIEIVPGGLLDQYSLIALLQAYRPAEVYNLAAQSFVTTSWSQPILTGEVTGEAHSIRKLVEIAFDHVGRKWEDHVVIDPTLVRPAEVDLLLGEASKARRVLGWAPRTSFEQLVRLMVDADVARLRRQSAQRRGLAA